MLEVERLSVTYAGAPALTDVSIDTSGSAVTAVLGLNGAGKTTLVRAISGVLPLHNGRVTSGDIRYRGESIVRAKTHRRVRSGIVHVPEGRRVIGTLSVEENLLLAASAVHSLRMRRPALDRVWDLFPVLAERRRQHAAFLSGGQQQMLAMGRGLVVDPQLLLLDEPTMGLSPTVAATIHRSIETIKAAGTHMLLVQQDIRAALAVADQAVLLDSGRLTWVRPAAEVLAQGDFAHLLFGRQDAREATGAAPVGPGVMPRDADR
jgi:branched-chain amino acid transport system ATP-binding protein